ncbi:hypothetical protein DV735_g978, partial [Chaetothyriales sp. CBS 134920]
MLLPALVVGIVSVALLYRLLRSPGIHRNNRRLARPHDTAPFVGNALSFLQPRHLLFDWFVRQQQAFDGDTYEISGPCLPPAVVITQPENIAFVVKNGSRVSRGSFFAARTGDLFGYGGIINATGSLARVQRELAVSFFTHEKTDDTLVTTLLADVYFSTTHASLARHAQTSEPLDLQRTILDLTTSVVSSIVYDSEAGLVSPQFSGALDYASDQIGRRFYNPLYPLTELLTGTKLPASIEQVKATGARIVQRARKRRAREAFASLCDDTEPQLDGLIDSLIDTLGGGGGSNPITLVADSALNLFYVARNTTAQWIGWTLYALLQDSSALTRVVAEISTLPQSERLQAVDLGASRIPYTIAVLHEALRLYPPVPIQIRQCEGDDGEGDKAVTLPDGTTLPPHTLIVWCAWAVNRSTALWGDDANLFLPARWLDGDKGQFQHDDRLAWGFPAFIGKAMAQLIVAWVVVAILRDFVIEEAIVKSDSSCGSSTCTYWTPDLTLRMDGGLPVRVKRREKMQDKEGARAREGTLEDGGGLRRVAKE